MRPVLSRAQMRAFDACAIEQCGVPSLVLMENAGRGATDVLEREILAGVAAGKRVVVVCGTGNNGGDGFVVARHLTLRGAEVTAVLVGDAERFTPDAKAQHDAWMGIGGDVTTSLDAIASADAIVDALFGTGLDRAVSGPAADAIGRINDSDAPVLAVDVPSGLDADSGLVHGDAVVARATACLAHYKRGLLTPRGAAHSGRLFIVDIGVPASLVLRTGHDADLIEDGDAGPWLFPREKDTHKYRAGHVGVMAGSSGKTGAALLCAVGALRGGAGAATIGTWPSGAASLESKTVEVMIARLDETGLDASVDAFTKGKRSLVVGPGFGIGDAARRAVSRVLSAFEGSVVLDADALTLFAGHVADLAAVRANLVLTPHAGEAARLLGATSDGIEADRYGSVRALAAKSRAVVLLKGAHTLVADPSGRVCVCPVACPALATAGSGDVLSGVLGALLCELAPFDAACAAALLHGRAGEAWESDRGLLAHEIGERVPKVLQALMLAHS